MLVTLRTRNNEVIETAVIAEYLARENKDMNTRTRVLAALCQAGFIRYIAFVCFS